MRSLLLNWRSNCINSRLRTKVKKAANFRAAVWFLAGMQLHWFLNQNCNLGLDWTNYKLRTNVNSDMFFPPFPFKWNDIVSCTVHIKKKGPKRCRFEWHCRSSSSPGRARQGKKKIFLPTSLHLSPKNIKKTPTITPCV